MTLSVEKIIELKAGGLTNREIARVYLGRDSRESTIRSILKRHEVAAVELVAEVVKKNPTAKIFLGDVEVAPTLAWVFGRFKAFVSPSHVEQEPYMLTWAGKWLDNPAIISRKLPDYKTFQDGDIKNDRELVEELWHMLDECDIFIAHNARFDRGWANQRFAYHGMVPPSPYGVIDTLAALKDAFSLPSNALEAATNYFELERKRHHEGITLWKRCCYGEVEAFEEMEFYNIGDIPTLEGLYLKVRPYMKKHPNVNLYSDSEEPVMRCVRCGSDAVHAMPGKVGTTYLSRFQAYRCDDCGSVMRDRRNIRTREEMAVTLANII